MGPFLYVNRKHFWNTLRSQCAALAQAPHPPFLSLSLSRACAFVLSLPISLSRGLSHSHSLSLSRCLTISLSYLYLCLSPFASPGSATPSPRFHLARPTALQWSFAPLLQLEDTLAERLRRRPAKPMGSPRVGSNPTGVAFLAGSHIFRRQGPPALPRICRFRITLPSLRLLALTCWSARDAFTCSPIAGQLAIISSGCCSGCVPQGEAQGVVAYTNSTCAGSWAQPLAWSHLRESGPVSKGCCGERA